MRKLCLIMALLLPTLLLGQSRLKGSFVCTKYTRWVSARTTDQDYQYNSPKGTNLIIRFSGNIINVPRAKYLSQHTYKVISVKHKYLDSSLNVKEYAYNLKDSHGYVLLLATVRDNGKEFQFDFFVGNTERTQYKNSSDL